VTSKKARPQPSIAIVWALAPLVLVLAGFRCPGPDPQAGEEGGQGTNTGGAGGTGGVGGGGVGGGGVGAAGGGGGQGCPPGLTECDGLCTDTDTDPDHCGECGFLCDFDEFCDGTGICASICGPGFVDCGGECIDPLTDPLNCGAGLDCLLDPGELCLVTEDCIGGVCSGCLDPLEIDCNGICCGADEACVGIACVPMLINGSFETGDFSGWTPVDLGEPFFAIDVVPDGVQAEQFFFLSQPTDGAFVALHGFDGGGPGEISLGQDVIVEGNAILDYDYRVGWDLEFAPMGSLDREFELRVEPAGGGVPLQVIPEFTANVGVTNVDTGDLQGQLDMSAFDGQIVFLRFVWTVPEMFTGPAQFQLDNVTLVRQ